MTLTRFDETTRVQDLAAGLNANADVIEPHLTALNPHPQGRLSRTVSGGQDVILTAEQARHTQLVFTGVLTGNINVIVPAAHMVYHVQNLTTNLSGAGPFSLTLKTGSGSGVVIQQASLPDHPRVKRVMVDGTDVVWADGSQVVEDNLHEASPANGYYIRYSDGTQICWSNDLTGINIAYAAGSIYRSAYRTWTFPAPFIDDKYFCTAEVVSAGSFGWGEARSAYATACTVVGYSYKDWPDVTMRAIAIGRW